MLFGETDGAGEPVEVDVVVAGLHAGPGELADTGDGNAGLFHEGEVGIPAGFGPLLGVPGGAEEWGVRSCILMRGLGDRWGAEEREG